MLCFFAEKEVASSPENVTVTETRSSGLAGGGGTAAAAGGGGGTAAAAAAAAFWILVFLSVDSAASH
jgi:hypothetical protein